MGRDPVIVVRDENGQVRVHLNTCRHRGVPLCRADSGNASHFRCSYHGWTYANTGELRGVTYQMDVYGKGVLDKKELPLFSPAQVDSELGLIFATWDPEAPSLREYLGDILWYLESIIGKHPQGMEVVGTPVRNIVRANWKTEGENLSGDGYHTTVTHASAFDLGLFATQKDLVKLADEVAPKFTGRTVTTANGHSMRVQRLPLRGLQGNHYFGYPKDMWPAFDERLDPGQQDLMSCLSVGHGSVFPNMSFIENFKTNVDGPDLHARYFRITVRYPIDATTSEQLWFFLAPKGADPEWARLSRLAYLRTNGPSGLFEIDDTENFVGISEASVGDVSADAAGRSSRAASTTRRPRRSSAGRATSSTATRPSGRSAPSTAGGPSWSSLPDRRGGDPVSAEVVGLPRGGAPAAPGRRRSWSPRSASSSPTRASCSTTAGSTSGWRSSPTTSPTRCPPRARRTRRSSRTTTTAACSSTSRSGR